MTWLNPKVGPYISFRLEQEYHDLLSVLVLEGRQTRSEYLRGEVITPYLAQKIRERTRTQFSSTVFAFTRHAKEFIGLAPGIPHASGLPSDKRRDDLEALVWKAMQDAADFMKTEEAAKNARARTHVMEVMAAVATIHLEIMKYQDRAAVQPLLERVEAGLRELEKTTGKSSGTA